MSDGTWNYRDRIIEEFLNGEIQNEYDSTFRKDFPNLSMVLSEVGKAIGEIKHDLDRHYAHDLRIDDMGNFERESIEKLREAVNVWLK